MLRTSFNALYSNLGVLSMASLRPPTELFMAQQSRFQSLTTLPTPATEFMKRKTFDGGENAEEDKNE